MSKMRSAMMVSVGLVAVLLLWRRGHHAPVIAEAQSPSAVASKPTSAPLRVPRLAAPSSLPASPPHATNPVEELHAKAAIMAQQWALATKPFNYDPVITGYYDRTNRRDGRITGVEVSTSTHSIELMRRSDGDMIGSANSHYDSQRTLPEHEAKWYQCTGTWTEQKAVAETRAILERMGATQTLAAIATHTYEATPLPLMTPDGQPVKVAPFVIVEFYNANGKRLLEAEYRMGESGPAGLVRWEHSP